MKKIYKCFIIMPFSKSSEKHTEDYWTNHFYNFLKPEIENIPNVEVYRSEELRGDIVRKIIIDLYDSDIVIANLTDYNPNVFWELGVRQSLQYRTITIAEVSTKLPFDISTKRCIFYFPEGSEKNKKFFKDLKNAIVDCIENPEEPDSIVLETISSRKGKKRKPPFKALVSNDYLENEKVLGIVKTKEGKFERRLNQTTEERQLNMRIVSYPENFKDQLFHSSNLNEIKLYLEDNVRESPRLDSFSNAKIIDQLQVRRDGLWFISKWSTIGSVYIGKDGILIYNWHYTLIKEEEKRFPYYYVIAFILGILDLLHKFYTHIEYSDNIKFILKFDKIEHWKFTPIIGPLPVEHYNYYDESGFDPIEKTFNVINLEQINKRIEIVSELLQEILLGFGFTDRIPIPEEFKKFYFNALNSSKEN